MHKKSIIRSVIDRHSKVWLSVTLTSQGHGVLIINRHVECLHRESIQIDLDISLHKSPPTCLLYAYTHAHTHMLAHTHTRTHQREQQQEAGVPLDSEQAGDFLEPSSSPLPSHWFPPESQCFAPLLPDIDDWGVWTSCTQDKLDEVFVELLHVF